MIPIKLVDYEGKTSNLNFCKGEKKFCFEQLKTTDQDSYVTHGMQFSQIEVNQTIQYSMPKTNHTGNRERLAWFESII